jgi:hypothetical protein
MQVIRCYKAKVMKGFINLVIFLKNYGVVQIRGLECITLQYCQHKL